VPSAVGRSAPPDRIRTGSRAATEQRLFPFQRTFRLDQLTIRGGKTRLSRYEGVQLILRVKLGDNLPCMNLIADVDGALGQPTVQSKRKVRTGLPARI